MTLDRRTFCKLVGGGIVVAVTTGPAALFAQRRMSYPEDLNAYLRIDETGRVTIFSGKVELGQGVMTSQAQMAAEELGVGLEAIDMVLGDTDRCPWDMGTFGSLTTRMFGPALRAAAAEGRAVMVKLAAKELGVPREQLVVENGVVSVAGDPSRKVTYGALAKGKQIARLVDEKAVLRSAKEMSIVGKSPKRLDGVDKVTGRAKYAGDVRRPGMLYARVLRPPVHGAKLKSIEAGPNVIQKDDLVAVLAPHPEALSAELAKIRTEWDSPKLDVDAESIGDYLVKHANEGEVKHARGDVAAARSAASKLFESTFRHGYVAHAPMEPHTAVAELVNGKMTVWAGTQTPFPTRDAIAKATGLDPKNVRVLTPYVGGGFGGKSSSRQAVEAARLAQLAGKPVQVAWTRSEEFFLDTFDPAAVVKIASAIDADGRITLWDYHTYFAGDRGTPLFYDIPHASIRASGSWSGASAHPFAVGPWRAPGANTNVFAAESQVDIMAAAAGIDPLAFRLKNTADPRMKRLLEACADAFGWQRAPGPSRKGRAVACGIDAGTYVALMAEVKVGDDGAIKVQRVVCAQDMGLVVNPDGAKMQMEGCVTMGLGYVLSEELRFQGGDILDRNFGSYHLPRFSQVPKIETVLVKNDELAPQGGGEPGIICMGAVIANAVFDATGVRMFRLPMTAERVRAAMKK